MVDPANRIVVGRITSAYGIKGWVKVFSYTQPMENILQYPEWFLVKGDEQRSLTLVKGKRHGKTLVAQLEGVNDRTGAEHLRGCEISVAVEELPELPEGEYYWHQLEGLRVFTLNGECLGQVDSLMETGANDVLVVRPTTDSLDNRQRLVPYVPEEYVREVVLDSGYMVVDWDPEF